MVYPTILMAFTRKKWWIFHGHVSLSEYISPQLKKYIWVSTWVSRMTSWRISESMISSILFPGHMKLRLLRWCLWSSPMKVHQSGNVLVWRGCLVTDLSWAKCGHTYVSYISEHIIYRGRNAQWESWLLTHIQYMCVCRDKFYYILYIYS